MDRYQGANTRRSQRSTQSSAVLWKMDSSESHDMGWLLESSEVGCAFAWRGDELPRVGQGIDLRLSCTETAVSDQPGIVRRVSRVHDDLAVICVEYLDVGVLAKRMDGRVLSGHRKLDVEVESDTLVAA